jgi:hypothetical protein
MSYQREAKIVLIGEGKFFKYEFDCSKARIPAFAAVSPNLETGPGQLSSYHVITRIGNGEEHLPWTRAAPMP